MKKITLIAAAVLTIGATCANAGWNSRTDNYGTTRTTGTGENFGSGYTSRTDNYGTTRIQGTGNNFGQNMTCRTDNYGNTRCN